MGGVSPWLSSSKHVSPAILDEINPYLKQGGSFFLDSDSHTNNPSNLESQAPQTSGSKTQKTNKKTHPRVGLNSRRPKKKRQVGSLHVAIVVQGQFRLLSEDFEELGVSSGGFRVKAKTQGFSTDRWVLCGEKKRKKP